MKKLFSYKILLINSLILFFSIQSFSQSIEAGDIHCFQICSDSSIFSWGSNTQGQCGDSSIISINSPKLLKPISNLKKILAANAHSVALQHNGNVICWGGNFSGQLGIGYFSNIELSRKITLISNVLDIDVGQGYTLALKNDSTVWGWGYNHKGNLGNGTTYTSNTPIQSIGLPPITKIASGEFHSLAISADSTIWAWGDNSHSQVSANIGPEYSPINMPGNNKFVDIEGGWWHNLALKKDSTVWAWGKNTSGQLGNGTFSTNSVPSEVIGLNSIIQISAGLDHSLALDKNGHVYVWGSNDYGELGLTSTFQSNIPILNTNLNNIAQISAGVNYSLVMDSSGVIYSFGRNIHGNLGIGDASFNGPIDTVLQLSGNINFNLVGSTLSANDTTHSVTNWHWNFGDGITSTLQNPTHNYTSNGNFNVCLTVSNGCYSKTTCDIVNVFGCNVFGTDTRIACDAITWIDGITYLSNNNTATYNIIGGSSNGCDSLVTLDLTISNLNANYTFTDNGNGDFSFTNASTGNYNQSHWAFGDGTIDSIANLNHTFITNGIFTVILTINDSTLQGDSCTSYFIDTINVTGVTNPLQCNSGFVIYPDTTGNVTILNNATGTNLTYLWDFGDGNTSLLQNPSHTYATAGPFYLCLTIDDGNGCTDMYCDSIGKNGVIFNKASGFTINVSSPNTTGINNNTDLNSEIKFYPNPTSNQLTIDTKQNISEIKIIDITGKNIKTITTDLNVINVADLSDGIYFIKLITDEKIITKKFVKQ